MRPELPLTFDLLEIIYILARYKTNHITTMKILKRILLVIVILIAIPLIIALFTKKDYAVEREIVINKPKQEVFDYIKFIKNQDNYSVWNMKDPNSKKTYKGEDGTAGFIYGWESTNKEVGTGEQEIVKIVDGDRVDMQLRFKVPFEAEDDAYMVTEDAGAGATKVKWGFKGSLKYPFNLFLLVMDMDKELGGALDQGLSNLKGIMEK